MKRGLLKRSLFTGRTVVFPAMIVVQILALARNLFVARIIGPEQFGIAAVFILISQFLDLTTDTGLNKFLLAHRHGQKTVVQASVHYVAFFRGLMIGALLLLLAAPLLRTMGAKPELGSICLLALLPVAIGLLHYDNARLQQLGRFSNYALSQVSGEIAGTVVTLLVAFATHSYIAVISGLVARASTQALVSHLAAERPYRIRMSKAIRADLFRYSAPLMLNGLVLFLSLQGDRAIVAYFFSPTTLGIYAASAQLLNAGATIVIRTFGATFMPELANSQRDPEKFAATYRRMSMIVLTTFVVMIMSFTAVGAHLVPLIYGKRFVVDPIMIALLGSVQGIRLVRVWPSTVALAASRTKLVLTANVIRVVVLSTAVLLAALNYGLNGLLVGYVLAELAALIISVRLLPLPAELRAASARTLLLVAAASLFAIGVAISGILAPRLAIAGSAILICVAIFAAATFLRTIRAPR